MTLLEHRGRSIQLNSNQSQRVITAHKAVFKLFQNENNTSIFYGLLRTKKIPTFICIEQEI